jgi:hypothetical protein
MLLIKTLLQKEMLLNQKPAKNNPVSAYLFMIQNPLIKTCLKVIPPGSVKPGRQSRLNIFNLSSLN